MNGYIKGALIFVVMVPAVFVLEAFIHGGPMTVQINTESVRYACLRGGRSRAHCNCVADEFRSRLDMNDIILRRLMFVRKTIPDKQGLYDDAELACNRQLK